MSIYRFCLFGILNPLPFLRGNKWINSFWAEGWKSSIGANSSFSIVKFLCLISFGLPFIDNSTWGQVRIINGPYQLIDSQKKITFRTAQLLPDTCWNNSYSSNFGREGGYGWVKLTILSSRNQTIWLEVKSHFIDTLRVGLVHDNAISKAGNMTMFHGHETNPLKHRYFLFPLGLQKDQKYTVLIQGYVPAPDILKLPFKIWQPIQFISLNQSENHQWMLFMGFMLMTVILGTLCALIYSHKSIYLYFTAYTFFLSVYALLNDGWGEFLPSYLQFLDHNVFLMHWLNMGLGFFILFSRQFLSVPVSNTLIRKAPWGVMVAAGISILIIQVSQQYQNTDWFIFGYKCLGLILFGYLPIWTVYVYGAIRRKFKAVWLHLGGVLFLVLFFLVSSLVLNTGLINLDIQSMVLLRWAMFFDVIIILVSWMYRNKLLEQERQQLGNEKRFHEQLAVKATLRQQEEEIKTLNLQNEIHQQRIRLARDLHDGIGSELTHIINRLDVLSLRTKHNQPLESLSDFTRATNQNLRDTLWVLNQKSITTQEWYDRTLQWLLKRWEDLNLPELITSFEGSSAMVLNPTVSISLFRITQEATNNSLKYANATQFEFIFREDEASIDLTIQDNGCGFDNVSKKAGYGLANIESRVEELSGKLAIESSNSNGTKIFLRIPIQKN